MKERSDTLFNDPRLFCIEENGLSGQKGFAIREVPRNELNRDTPADQLPGVMIKGVCYYDLQHIGYISNTGMADLITLMKSLLQQGMEARFVNVNDRIKERIKAMGLDTVIPCT